MTNLIEDPNTGDLIISEDSEPYEPLGGWEALEGLEPPENSEPSYDEPRCDEPEEAPPAEPAYDEASLKGAYPDEAYVSEAAVSAGVHLLLQPPREPLEVYDSEQLTDMRFKPIRWVVEGFLKPGLTVLAGAPKVGKSWLVLQLCMKIAKGEPLWGMSTRRGAALYIALEDSVLRLQQRILNVTDAPSRDLYLATTCSPLGDELERELGDFVRKHLSTRIIVIDTFQRIRDQSAQMSYANDYAEVSRLKRIADELEVCLVLVHHTRKLSDSDRFNEISGTNGIAGSADTLMVLTKEKRTSACALLSVTGRDITDRELRLSMDRTTCVWDCDNPPDETDKGEPLPEELMALRHFIRSLKCYEGTSTALAGIISECIGRTVPPKTLGQMMNRYRYELEESGISFYCTRTAAERTITLVYSSYGDSCPDDK